MAVLVALLQTTCKPTPKSTDALPAELDSVQTDPTIIGNWADTDLNVLYRTTGATPGETVEILTNKTGKANPYFLSDDTNFILLRRYAQRGSKRHVLQTDTLISNEYVYTTIDSESIKRVTENGKDCLYISVLEREMGNAVLESTIGFYRIELSTFKTHTLTYSGKETTRSGSGLEGGFNDDAVLNQNPEIKNQLYEHARGNKLIFSPAGKEAALGYYKNYEVKWNKDNDEDNALATGHGSIPDTILSTYYSEDLFGFTGNYNPEDVTENDRYKVVSYFRGNIVAYDKTRNRYFPVFIESCVLSCNKSVRFVSNGVIEVTYTEGGAYLYR